MAKLAVVQGARSEGKISTGKIDEGCHPAEILTKTLQGKEFGFKRRRLLELRATPPTRPSSSVGATANACGPEGEAGRARDALPGQLPEHGAGRSGGCSGEGVARSGPGKGHR